MSTVTVSLEPRLDVVSMLQETLSLLGRNVQAFGVWILLLEAPGVVFGLGRLATKVSGVFFLIVVIAGLAGVLCHMILQGALIYRSLGDLEGGPPPNDSALNFGIQNWAVLLGLNIAAGVCVALGLVLLVVPGVMLALAWSAAAPVLLMEARGISGSLTRSADLTRGRRLQILMFLLLLWVGVAIIEGLVLGHDDWGHPHVLKSLILSPLVNTANILLGTASISVLYRRLSILHEGAAPAAAAQTFL